jgi:glycosyltransferase involved in cell wall biosynthesis
MTTNQSLNTKRICLISSVPVLLWRFYPSLIAKLQSFYQQITIIASDQSELHIFKNDFGCNIVPMEISRQISPLKDVLSIVKITRYLSREKYDLVHAHTPKGGLAGMVGSYLAQIPNRIYTIHGLPLETATGIKRRLLRGAEKLACRCATSVLAVSNSLRQRIIDENICPEKKIKVFAAGSACGVDPNYFNPDETTFKAGREIRRKYQIPDQDMLIGYVGRVVPDKGIEILVNVFESVQQQLSNCHLLLIGEFETVRDTLPSHTITKINTNPHIHYNDAYVRNIPPCYAAMDMVVLPTRREGFGLSLLEAAAMGLPTVATRVTGCVDAVVDNETGLLVEVDHETQLTHALLKLARDPELRQKFGQQGRKRVQEMFHVDLLTRAHMQLYSTLLSN